MTGGGQRVSCPDLVGRGEELDLLVSAFESAAGGRAATVLVGGEAGIGKSRLVDELCTRARDQGAIVAAGVCVPVDGGGLPYGPVAGILRDLAHQLGEVTAAAVLGPLAAGLGPATSADGSAESLDKTRLFESILASFTRAAERSPLVLVFDDLQWADSASAELLGFLTRNLTDSRLLVVGTYRSDEVGPDHELRPWLAELSRHRRVTQLHLEGLDREQLGALIEGILGHQPDWTLAEAVWARSQGNPFFAEELTAAGPAPSLPPELRRVIMTRVDRLPKKTQQLLRIAAVAGPAVEHRLLAAVAGDFSPDALDEALTAAVDDQLLVVDESQSGYRFRHALLREAIDASLLPGERARLHRLLAGAVTADPSLVAGPPDHRAAALAVHWWEAGEWTETFAASRHAAEAAEALWAFPEALVHVERALSALERMPADAQPTPAELLQLLDRASDLAYLSGAGARSVELIAMAIERSDAAADPAAMARRLAVHGRNTWGMGDSEGAFDSYRKAVELMPADPPSAELARVMAEEARGLMLMSRSVEAERRCLEAIAVARAVGASAEEGHALNTMGCCIAGMGRVDEGTDLLREALAIAEDLGAPDDLDRAYTNLSSILVDAGRLEEAATLVFDSLATGEHLSFLKLNGAAANSAHALTRLGRYDEAAKLVVDMGDQGIGICATAPQLVPAPIEIRRGRFDEASRLLAEADAMTTRLSDVQTRGLFHIQSAELALEQGQPGDAYEHVQRALDLAAGTDDEVFRPEMCALGVRALADRVDDDRAHGRRVDVDKARLLAAELVHEVDRVMAACQARDGQILARTPAFTALCTAEQSRLERSDPELWTDAAASWHEAGEPFPTAYCRWREAEAVLERRGDRGQATTALQDAFEVAVRLGAVPLRDRVEQLARRGRIPLHDAGEGSAGQSANSVAADLGLTPREVEVLGQLAAGRTDREIAETLFISKKTASVHVSNLLRKLDVTNRVEAGRIGQAHGLT